jgi:hypothetical protein
MTGRLRLMLAQSSALWVLDAGAAEPSVESTFEASATDAGVAVAATERVAIEARDTVRDPHEMIGTREAAREIHVVPVVVETLSLLVVMRATEAYLWPNPFSFRQIDEWPDRYRVAFTLPPKFDTSRRFMEWDGDDWTINVLGHGLFGSELYLRPRRCGFGWLGSLGYAAAASALWEYGFEANGVRPSGVDLWYTPLSGIVIGEARFQLWRLSGKVNDATWRSILGAVADPIGEFAVGLVGAPC